jgi:hypothetical protein
VTRGAPGEEDGRGLRVRPSNGRSNGRQASYPVFSAAAGSGGAAEMVVLRRSNSDSKLGWRRLKGVRALILRGQFCTPTMPRPRPAQLTNYFRLFLPRKIEGRMVRMRWYTAGRRRANLLTSEDILNLVFAAERVQVCGWQQTKNAFGENLFPSA